MLLLSGLFYLTNLNGKCCNLTFTSSSLFFGKDTTLLADFLSSRPNFINKFMDVRYPWNCVPGKFQERPCNVCTLHCSTSQVTAGQQKRKMLGCLFPPVQLSQRSDLHRTSLEVSARNKQIISILRSFGGHTTTKKMASAA
jgi:hypothetical protein